MPLAVFREMKAYIGFDDRDAANLAALRDVLRPGFPEIVDHFYEVLLRHPGAASVFTDQGQVARLRRELNLWLESLFGGNYDDYYVALRSEIGRVHVRVGLAQHYMFAAMEIIRQDLQQRIMQSGIEGASEKLESLHKLLTLETGVMLETYKESYSQQVRDLERGALHDRLARAEHLAQIGQLATTLAHEIKNPLAGISGAIQVIRDQTAPDGRHQPIFEEIIRQIDRLDRAVRDLLIYARPQPLRIREADLTAVVHRTIELLRKEPQVRRVRLDFQPEPLPLLCFDEDQIEQVLMNIILNAVHASPDAATITIKTLAKSDTVRIVVKDRGQGMSESVRQRAFEPFFTTKVRGTGLGLPICRRIISGHGGNISLESSPGAGTTVTIELPVERERVS